MKPNSKLNFNDYNIFFRVRLLHFLSSSNLIRESNSILITEWIIELHSMKTPEELLQLYFSSFELGLV